MITPKLEGVYMQMLCGIPVCMAGAWPVQVVDVQSRQACMRACVLCPVGSMCVLCDVRAPRSKAGLNWAGVFSLTMVWSMDMSRCLWARRF
jgi:hypothetical protein